MSPNDAQDYGPSAAQRLGVRFETPPAWPIPPLGWLPPKGWTPPESWPPAPVDWHYIVAASGDDSILHVSEVDGDEDSALRLTIATLDGPPRSSPFRNR